MAGFKIQAFRGTAPKVSPELLQNTQAQTAKNCKLYSGDLLAFPQAVFVGYSGINTTTNRTLFAQKDPVTDTLFFYVWDKNVSVTTPSFSEVNEQKFYYTGDGPPKVSTFNLATTFGGTIFPPLFPGAGIPPYPDDWYQLGLPLPTTKPVTVATPFTQKTSASISRDATGVATIVTTTPHELLTGNNVTITGFSTRPASVSFNGTISDPHVVTLVNHGFSTGASLLLTFGTPVPSPANLPGGYYTITVTGVDTFTLENRTGASPGGSGTAPCDVSIADFNTQLSAVTVIDATTFTYLNSGPQMTTLANTNGKIDIGQTSQLRTYVYTWITPWLEESIPSEPSLDLILKEGQVVTVTNLPTAKPAEPQKNFIGGIRLYRTFAGLQASDYFLLKTLWFQMATRRVSRTANVSRIKMSVPHNFIIGDRFKSYNHTIASFNITGGVVTKIIDELTFEYAQTGTDVAETADATGLILHDVAENNNFPAIYWGDPANSPNEFTFTDNFSTNSLVLTLESEDYLAPPENLQGIKTVNGSVLVGFVNNRVYFSEPNKFHAWPIKYELTLEYDIVAVEPVSSLGVIVLTKGFPYLISGDNPPSNVQRVDSMYPCVSAKSVVVMNYGVAYATHEGIAVFSANSGSQLVTAGIFSKEVWKATFPNPENIVATYFNDAYLVSDGVTTLAFYYDQQTGGDVVTFDEVFTATWYDSETNKLYFIRPIGQVSEQEIVARDQSEIIARNGSRILSNILGLVFEWDNTAQPSVPYEWKSKVIVTQSYMNFGAARIIADYDNVNSITFKMWTNKTLLTTMNISNNQIFRLPTGYKADTFEVSVSGTLRIRAIHVADTPNALREI